VETSKQESVADFAMSPEEVVEFFRTYFGPTKRAFEQLNETGQNALRRDLVEHWKKYNEGDANHTIIRGEYLEVHARP
jgi:hypothetical protein